MGQNVADALDVDADGPVSPHHIAAYVVVEFLGGLRLEYYFNFGISLRWHHSVHGFHGQRVGVFKLAPH